jgi:hypothetical protein
MIGRPTLALLSIVGMLVGASSAAHAAEWRFEPVLDAGAEYTDNVQLDDPRRGEQESDYVYRAALRLGLVGRTARSDLSFHYTPAHEAFVDFSEFDNTSHSVGTAWTYEASPLSTWSLTGAWDQRERVRVSLEEGAELVDLISFGVIETTSYSARLQGLLTASERHRWVVAADGGGTEYEESATTAEASLDDTTRFGGEIAWETDLAERTTAGTMVRAERLDEGIRGEWDIYSLILGLTTGTPERLQLTISGGYTTTRLIEADELEFEDEPTSESGSIAVLRELGARTTLSAGASREVGGSRGTAGLAIVDTFYLRYALRASARSSFVLVGNWTDRDPVEDDAEILADRGITTLGFRAEWSYSISPRFAIVVSGDRVDQTTDSDELAEVDRNVYGLSLRWSPLAARR